MPTSKNARLGVFALLLRGRELHPGLKVMSLASYCFSTPLYIPTDTDVKGYKKNTVGILKHHYIAIFQFSKLER